MSLAFDVVIVGAGHAGAQTAISLRQLGFGGAIAIVGEESDLPYERPPLSKEYFAGEKSFERIPIRPPEFWDERDILVMTSTRINAVDPVANAATTSTGKTILCRKLVWAAGGAARSLALPVFELPGVQMLRTRSDADAMRAAVETSRQTAIIGGGFIGLEAAAVLSKMGKKVVVLEAADRVLARVAAAPLSRFFEAEHRKHGVDIRTGVVVEGVEGCLVATGVRLAGGEKIDAQLVIVGVGIRPAVDALLAAGANGGNGVLVDDYCRTSLSDVFAIGDCALHRNPHADGSDIRLESVQNANDMAMTVAKEICGRPEPYTALPWFWSNQYDLRLQTVGLSIGHDEYVIRGEPSTRSFSVIYLKNKRVIALDCVNATKDYVQGKALILSGVQAAPSDLLDSTLSLKALAAQSRQ